MPLPPRVEIDGARHMAICCPGCKAFGDAGFRSVQFRKLFRITPVPGIITPDPYGEPRLCVRQIIFPSESAIDIDVVFSLGASAMKSASPDHFSVSPSMGIPSPARVTYEVISDRRASTSFGLQRLCWMRSPAAMRIARNTKSRCGALKTPSDLILKESRMFNARRI